MEKRWRKGGGVECDDRASRERPRGKTGHGAGGSREENVALGVVPLVEPRSFVAADFLPPLPTEIISITGNPWTLCWFECVEGRNDLRPLCNGSEH